MMQSQANTLPNLTNEQLVEALLEKKRRLAAKTRLIDFIKYVSPYYVADPFHEYVCDKLDDVVSGKTRKLMIFAPPQHGKSMITSEHFPAYYLGKHPNSNIIITSYGATLAREKSSKARNHVESVEYQRIFGKYSNNGTSIETNMDTRAKDRWELKAPMRGGCIAAGVDGAITGFGAALGIIDDPIASWKEAQSAITRDNGWAWYQNTFLSRVHEGGQIVLIMTRWHQMDLAGRLLQTEGDEWQVLRFPALAESQDERDKAHFFLSMHRQMGDLIGREEGEALAPNRYSRETLLERRKTSGWSSIYQQVPRDPDGEKFKRAWFENEQIVPFAPKECLRIRYWDKAGSTSETAKYTAGVLMAYDKSTGKIYIEDVVRGKWAATDRERIIKDTARADKEKYGKVTIWIEQEPGSGGLESADATVTNLIGFTVRKDRPSGNKDVRLEPFESYAGNMNVYLVRGSWNTDFVEELIAIPNGTYRDQSDAAAGAFNKLTSAKRSFTPRVVKW